MSIEYIEYNKTNLKKVLQIRFLQARLNNHMQPGTLFNRGSMCLWQYGKRVPGFMINVTYTVIDEYIKGMVALFLKNF